MEEEWGGGAPTQGCLTCQRAHAYPLVQEPGDRSPLLAIFTWLRLQNTGLRLRKKPPWLSTYCVPGLRWHFLLLLIQSLQVPGEMGDAHSTEGETEAQRGTDLSKVTRPPRRATRS